jgi:hypothetical protein
MASRPGPIGEQRGQPDAHARLCKFLLQSQRLNQPIGLQEFSARRQFARRTWAARNSVEWCEEALLALSGGAVAKGRQHRRDRSRNEREGGIMPHVTVAPSPDSSCCLTSNLRSLIRTLKRHLHLFSSEKNPLLLHGRLQRYHQQSTERSCVLRFEPIGRRFRDERSQRIQLPSLT